MTVVSVVSTRHSRDMSSEEYDDNRAAKGFSQ